MTTKVGQIDRVNNINQTSQILERFKLIQFRSNKCTKNNLLLFLPIKQIQIKPMKIIRTTETRTY